MAQTIAANEVTLKDLKQSFGLQQIHKDTFFPEWCATPEAWSPVAKLLFKNS